MVVSRARHQLMFDINVSLLVSGVNHMVEKKTLIFHMFHMDDAENLSVHTFSKFSLIFPGMIHWIGLRDNLQETLIF